MGGEEKAREERKERKGERGSEEKRYGAEGRVRRKEERGRERVEKEGIEPSKSARNVTSDQHPPSPQRYVAGVMLGTRRNWAIRGRGEV